MSFVLQGRRAPADEILEVSIPLVVGGRRELFQPSRRLGVEPSSVLILDLIPVGPQALRAPHRRVARVGPPTTPHAHGASSVQLLKWTTSLIVTTLTPNFFARFFWS